MLISGEFPPLESIDFFDAPSSSFYNTIEMPSDLPFAWPDLTANYAPYDEDAMRDTDDSRECGPSRRDLDIRAAAAAAAAATSEMLNSRTADSSSPILISDESELTPTDELARVQLEQLRDNEMRWRQTLEHLAANYNPGTVLGEVQQMERQLRDELTNINSILDKSVLQVDDLFAALSLKGRYENDIHHAEILEQEELYHLEEDGEELQFEELVTLDWVDQPLAKSFKNKNRARATNKKKKGHCTMTARLLCAPGVKFNATSPVTAYFYQVDDEEVVVRKGRSRKRASPTTMDSMANEEMSDIQIQNNVERLPKGGNLVTFDFRFPAGTRNKPCSIRLHVTGVVTLADGTKSRPLEIISQPTHRFIITTNECQFETAELKLLLMELFAGDKQTCSWTRFVNALNVRWMRVTRQEADSGISVVAERALSSDDYRFIASFFRNAPQTVTREEVSKFYSFFGKATHHYRHNLPFRQLMLEGLVWGFMSKSESTRLLQSQPEGAFLIRVSESSPGSFCLSWKADQYETVRHGLLDVKLFSPPALAEFLMSKSMLKSVVLPFSRVGRSQVSKITLRSKGEAFGCLLSSMPPSFVKKEEGYCDLMSM